MFPGDNTVVCTQRGSPRDSAHPHNNRPATHRPLLGESWNNSGCKGSREVQPPAPSRPNFTARSGCSGSVHGSIENFQGWRIRSLSGHLPQFQIIHKVINFISHTQLEFLLMQFDWVLSLGASTQNHRMVGVGRDVCGSSSPTLLPKQGHLQQAAEDLVQAGL